MLFFTTIVLNNAPIGIIVIVIFLGCIILSCSYTKEDVDEIMQNTRKMSVIFFSISLKKIQKFYYDIVFVYHEVPKALNDIKIALEKGWKKDLINAKERQKQILERVRVIRFWGRAKIEKICLSNLQRIRDRLAELDTRPETL